MIGINLDPSIQWDHEFYTSTVRLFIKESDINHSLLSQFIEEGSAFTAKWLDICNAPNPGLKIRSQQKFSLGIKRRIKKCVESLGDTLQQLQQHQILCMESDFELKFASNEDFLLQAQERFRKIQDQISQLSLQLSVQKQTTSLFMEGNNKEEDGIRISIMKEMESKEKNMKDLRILLHEEKEQHKKRMKKYCRTIENKLEKAAKSYALCYPHDLGKTLDPEKTYNLCSESQMGILVSEILAQKKIPTSEVSQEEGTQILQDFVRALEKIKD